MVLFSPNDIHTQYSLVRNLVIDIFIKNKIYRGHVFGTKIKFKRIKKVNAIPINSFEMYIYI